MLVAHCIIGPKQDDPAEALPNSSPSADRNDAFSSVHDTASSIPSSDSEASVDVFSEIATDACYDTDSDALCSINDSGQNDGASDSDVLLLR